MRNKIRKIIGMLLIVVGIAIVLLPYLFNLTTKKQMNNKIEKFENFTIQQKQKGDNSVDELYRRLDEYNQILYHNGQEIVDAFSYQDVSVDLKEYGYTENIIGSIIIPQIDIELPIYLGATEENLYKGSVHLSNTSIPIGGSNTNAVIAAHRGLVRNKMFRHLDKLNIGDEITIKNLWGELNYKVSKIKIIEPTDISQIYIQEGKDLITLITCHPYRVNTQRYVVVCERVNLDTIN